MENIEKRYTIDSGILNGALYFNSILQEAYICGLLNNSDIENIQLQFISLLSYKCGRYNFGESSSIRVETAESIMKSNLYTIGLYLKSLPNPDYAVQEVKTIKISELYERGRELVNTKFQTAKYIYNLVQKNKTTTLNQSYNSTLSENGIGIFFKLYNLEYEVHESPASIDYQLCNPVTDLEGVEFILKYLETLYLENEFCMNFTKENIHHLLCGYEEGYKHLLINIFEQVLTAVLGCSLAKRNIRELNILRENIQYLHNELSELDDNTLTNKIHKVTKDIFEELNISSPPLQKYIEKSLPKIIITIASALKTNTLNKVFISQVNLDLEPKIHFTSSRKMDDKEYRILIEELLSCRYSSDKLSIIKEKIKSFDDIEDILLDAQFGEEEFALIFDTLGNIELAALIKRHPFKSAIQAVDLSEKEQVLRLCLKNYIRKIPIDRQEQIFEIVYGLDDDY